MGAGVEHQQFQLVIIYTSDTHFLEKLLAVLIRTHSALLHIEQRLLIAREVLLACSGLDVGLGRCNLFHPDKRL
jgi:hypothetical protein